ncbi:hypothetical protein CgunFtcFv8_022628 [Champsocephalus gunnari]|uniref:Uncharacterized protein n=1 Tax=Champsocephalus gunnari TaxID=52237 RepID=A0AAN8DQ97_CHAGU|nr:hypothetical protein CgunFtcFv8_022628 [Champsocephalus gunnari]
MSGRAPVAAKDAGTGPHAIPSWGSRLDLTMVSPAEDVLELNYMEDEEDASEFLLSDSDEQEDDVFMSPAQAAKPGAMAALSGDSTPASPCLSIDLQAVCQRAAARLDIPWPKVVKETSRSRYEGKLFFQTTRTKRQLLPVFPEMLDEVSVSWRDRPFSNKAPIQGASSLDCDGMERLGLLHIPPMEPLVAAHLLPRMGPSPSRNPTLPAKTDRFQSTMTERAYKAAALSARALNVSSMLTAYQAELCEDLSSDSGPATLDEIAAVTDICFRVQRCAVQATGKVMGIMVVQEKARWLNLTNLPDREKEDVRICPSFPREFSAPFSLPCRGGASRKRRKTRPSTSVSLEGSSRCLRNSDPSPKLLRTLLDLEYQISRGRSPPRVPSPGRRRGRVGLENLRSRLQPRRSQPRISASNQGGRSERHDSPSFPPL